jgi:hypothetical protein
MSDSNFLTATFLHALGSALVVTSEEYLRNLGAAPSRAAYNPVPEIKETPATAKVDFNEVERKVVKEFTEGEAETTFGHVQAKAEDEAFEVKTPEAVKATRKPRTPKTVAPQVETAPETKKPVVAEPEVDFVPRTPQADDEFIRPVELTPYIEVIQAFLRARGKGEMYKVINTFGCRRFSEVPNSLVPAVTEAIKEAEIFLAEWA